MADVVAPHIVETWVKGWSLAREVPPPIPYGSGFRTELGWADAKTRYVFPALSQECRTLASTIHEPYVFIKVCAPAEALAALLPAPWEITTHAFMMVCPGPMGAPKHPLPPGYRLEVITAAPVFIVRVLTTDGEEAAIGRIAISDGYAIYDRIATQPDHQRRGLGSIVMKALEEAALENGASQGLLVATPEGKALYESLNWQFLCPYTTAAIPAEK